MPNRLPTTTGQLMVEAMRQERRVQADLRRNLRRRLEDLSVVHGAQAPMTEAFWLEVWKCLAIDPWATCGNLAAAVRAMLVCQTAIQALSREDDKNEPLRAFRAMTERVLRLVGDDV